jgi:hypothetical protein
MKLNDKGFSLIQVLISSGLLGAAAVVGIKMMNNQQKVAESTNQKYEMAYIHEEIWRTLRNPLTCEKTLYGKSINEWNQGNLKSINVPYKDGKYDNYLKIYKTYNSGYEFYGIKNLKIDSYTLKPSPEEGLLSLRINFDRGKNTSGSQKVTRTIPIQYTLQDGEISTCKSAPLKDKNIDLDDENELQTPEHSNISLSIKTSIGKNIEPQATLDIHGALSITTSKDNTQCSLDKEGSIRFNEVSYAYELCLGHSGWTVWGKDRIDWQRSTNVVVQAGKRQLIGKFKYCSLTAVKDTKVTNCKIENDNTDFKNMKDWFTSNTENLENGSCTFTCFD